MNSKRFARLLLAGAIALAMLGTAAIATAQTTTQGTDPPPTSAATFYPGSASSATYTTPHGTLTVNSGMPGHVTNYGPPPAFSKLDSNHDGRISSAEAQAYIPLASDFLFASHHAKTISRAQYQQWVKTQY